MLHMIISEIMMDIDLKIFKVTTMSLSFQSLFWFVESTWRIHVGWSTIFPFWGFSVFSNPPQNPGISHLGPTGFSGPSHPPPGPSLPVHRPRSVLTLAGQNSKDLKLMMGLNQPSTNEFRGFHQEKWVLDPWKTNQHCFRDWFLISWNNKKKDPPCVAPQMPFSRLYRE